MSTPDAERSGFGDTLRQLRLSRGLTQEDVAGGQFSASYISRVESGQRPPTPELLDHLSSVLNIDRTRFAAAAWQPEEPSVAASARLAALLSDAERALQAHDLETAVSAAEAAQHVAASADHPETWWRAHLVAISAHMEAARYEQARELAEELCAQPWVQTEASLRSEAHRRASIAARLSVDLPLARAHARAAMDFVRDRPAGDGHRIEAMIAWLATKPEVDRSHLDMFSDDLQSTVDQRLAGLGAWAMGNIHFEAGDAGAGIRWHDEAGRHLERAGDFTNWARFCRSSADERLRARRTEGVALLLEKAQSALAVLGNPDELADLARTRSCWALERGEVDQALSILEDALRDEAPDLAMGRLHLATAQIQRDRDPSEAHQHGLSAARLLTGAGATEEAMQAWDIIDHAPTGTGGP